MLTVPAVDLIASIPSPSNNSIGPFTLYGLIIAIAVVAAVWLGQRRWMAVGGAEDDISAIAVWGVPAGVIGARIYHVITDWQLFEDRSFWQIFNIRAGGLGVPGGMLLGMVVGVMVARRRGIPLRSVLDAAVPSLPLAQAIGRWGNWFNQELYGSPTDLPWGLEIDPAHRPEAFATEETFHPTFLYESLWNFGLVGVMIWIDRKGWLPRGRLIAVYLLGYGVARLWLETVRIDPANEIAGLRVNIWMSLALIVGGLIVLAWPRAKSGSAISDDVGQTADRSTR